ncbi:dienelactone hydrolase family protein [Neoroseomonas oryzicola]|uniref:Alpha/beta hydrolase n=2 Tax=Neoroseomonas oryzicola TaxID=535904 RepID=A0ABX1EJV4_9PROT|nr:alpha/beta family hydrolase [Neoroseomonas oryzicola]NKE18085.1 alpha/beta hydrolase [Neoroseomonas oryzicola]
MSPPPPIPDERLILPPAGMEGLLASPPAPVGLVLFAHGSGSSRLSPRNRQVARALREAGLATLLFDLLTEAEAQDRHKVFDIPLLADRLAAAMDALAARPASAALPVGLFGASTGAAAALRAAAARGAAVRAVVSRGGRPDLAGGGALSRVTAPTLLIVGGEDREVLALNRSAAGLMTCPVSIEVVPGATHLFEEPGALEEVAQLAAGWFRRWLAA